MDSLSITTGTPNPDVITVQNADSKGGLKLSIQPAGSEAVTSASKNGAAHPGTPLQFNVLLRDEKGRTFRDPIAMTAVTDRNNPDTQRLYVVLKNVGEKSEIKYGVGEITIYTDRLGDTTGAVIPGRIFHIPVHSTFTQAALSVASNNRLYVSIKQFVDYPGLPMTMVYDISPGSKKLDPIKVLLPPKR